jgi:hypothetical protein
MMKGVLLTSALTAAVSGADLRLAPKNKLVPNTYVVRLVDEYDRHHLDTHISEMRSHFPIEDFLTDHIYGALADHHRASYSVKLTPKSLKELLSHPGVKFIEEDEVVSLADCRSQTDEDWGTARINHKNYNSSQSYSYDYTTGNEELASVVAVLSVVAVSKPM